MHKRYDKCHGDGVGIAFVPNVMLKKLKQQGGTGKKRNLYASKKNNKQYLACLRTLHKDHGKLASNQTGSKHLLLKGFSGKDSYKKPL